MPGAISGKRNRPLASVVVLRAPPNIVQGFGVGAIREAFNALGTANILNRLSLQQQRSLLDLSGQK